jgi:hypothetical protein
MIPHLFRPYPIPKTISTVFQKQITQFSLESNSDEEFIKKCFFFVVSLQKGHRINIFLKFSRLFWTDIEQIFNFRGYFHCTTSNYLLRTMLVKSGRISEKDIQQISTSTWGIFPHQYLRVKMGKNKYLNLDAWAYRFGIEFGDYSRGFHTGGIFPVR